MNGLDIFMLLIGLWALSLTIFAVTWCPNSQLERALNRLSGVSVLGTMIGLIILIVSN